MNGSTREFPQQRQPGQQRPPSPDSGATGTQSPSKSLSGCTLKSQSSSIALPATHRKSSRRKRICALLTCQSLAIHISPIRFLQKLTTVGKWGPTNQSKAFSRMQNSAILNVFVGISLTLLLTIACSLFSVQTTNSLAVYGKAMDVVSNDITFHIFEQLNKTLQSSLSNPQHIRHVETQLEHSFSVPPSLSLKIPTAQRYALLTKLQSTRLPKTNNAPRLFVLHAIGNTLERRFQAIATAITYAQNTERFLVVLWDTAHGLQRYGNNVLKDRELTGQQDLLLCDVDDLHLSPNITHWSEYSINYFTTPTKDAYPLDHVADLATRHIFYRADGQVEGRYASMLPGVILMPARLQVGSKGKREWDSFVKQWTFPQLDSATVSDTLNRVYGVPWVFINGMRDEKQRLFLRLLNKSTSKRAFFIHAQFGLGNRLRALGSAMAIAHVTGRVLVLIWEPDVHLDCVFNDLFVNELVVIEKLNMNWPPKGRTTKDHAMQTVDFYNFMRNEGHGRHNPMKELVNPRNGRHVYVKSAYVVRSSFTPRIISTRSDYWKIMREELVPRVEIMQLVLDPMFARIHDMIGVHIRARTIENDIKGIGHEFYGSASRTTDHWRKRTGLKTFESKIAKLSMRYKYFVAADMKEAIHELERKFGSHRILSVVREGDCVTRDVECAKLALVDILLLSRVSTLLGSHWSSFSEAAVRLSGHVKVLLAGLHFG